MMEYKDPVEVSSDNYRLLLEDGESVELDSPDGHSMKHEPWTHRVENIGTTDISAILFERK